MKLNKNQLTRRIFLRYIATLVAFVVCFILAGILMLAVYHTVIIYPDNIFYHPIVYIRDNLPLFLAIPLLAGWAVITFYFMKSPLNYLDDIIDASKLLASQSEEQIILPDDLKSVQDDFNHMRETSRYNALMAKENEQRKNDLIMYLAHDLKTPIASIIGYLTLLHDEKLPEATQEQYISTVLNKAERLDELINEFFEITRFNLAHIELTYGTIDLTRMLQQMVFDFQPLLEQKQLTCTLDMPDSVSIQCDANQLERVFDNLFRNAINYSYNDTNMFISAEVNEESVIMHFINHGHTIPKEKLNRLFDQFFRLDQSRSTSSGGAGLGLAIAKNIISEHGGTMTADSRDETIDFTIMLPIHPVLSDRK